MKSKKKKKKRDKKHKKDRDKGTKIRPEKVAVKSGSKYQTLSWICFGLSGACAVIAIITFVSQGEPPKQEKLEIRTTMSTTSTTSTTTSTSTTSTTTSTTTIAPRCCSRVWFRGDVYTVLEWNDSVWSTANKPKKYLTRTDLGSWVQSHFIDGSRPFLQTNPNFAECPTDETQWFYCYCVQRSCDCSNDFARFEIINKYPICA